jgi:hypothetical protein
MKNENLIEWLTDSRSAAFFGRSFAIRADVLAHLITGNGSQSEIGRKHKVSKQAVWKHAQKARTIFFPPSIVG